MISLELDEVEIDRCFSCGGIWLDRGELELLLEGAVAREEFISSFRIDTETEEKPRRCPICDKRMEKVLCGSGKGVLIDRCKTGDGIWLDRGELREILEAASFGGDSRVLDLLKEMLARERR
jgi:Zn-finger nucleic acid-binding protein